MPWSGCAWVKKRRPRVSISPSTASAGTLSNPSSREIHLPRAIRIHEVGGPEVMRLEDVAVPAPAPDEVQVQHTAIGVNFIDVYDRSGLYPQKGMPAGLGREAA